MDNELAGMEGVMVDLIEPGRYLSKITSIQVRRNLNGEIYFATVLGRILEGEPYGEPWMDILRPDHPVPAIAKCSRRKVEELLKATGVKQIEEVKRREVGTRINILRGANVITGYWSAADPVNDPSVNSPPDGGEQAELTW
jgi:hypothetical protein